MSSYLISIKAFASVDDVPVVNSFLNVSPYESSLKGLYERKFPHYVFLWAIIFYSKRFGHWLRKAEHAFSIVFVDTNSGDTSLIIALWVVNEGIFNNSAETIFLISSSFICLWIFMRVSMASFELKIGVYWEAMMDFEVDFMMIME